MSNASPTENTPPILEPLPDAVTDAAISWSVKLKYGNASADTLQSFEQWLDADRSHAVAWARIGSLQQEFSKLPAHLMLKAMQAFEERCDQRSIDRREAIKLLSLAGLITTLGWGIYEHTPWQRLFADANTTFGEQRTLTLPDGTTVLLNSDSAISIEFIGDRRLLVLKRGEILITTGADTSSTRRRPFWVYTSHGRMEALGTRFVVRLEERATRVSVQEGAVALYPAEVDTTETVYVGESRWLSTDEVVAADLFGFETDAWADGVIAGKHIPLVELLAELERYRLGRIVCDERVRDLRVTGVFQIRNTDLALEFLRQTQPVNITYRTRYWVSVGPKSTS
jgi:transmembrane sensor